MGIWLIAGPAAAERLPVHRVTSADGLAHDSVRCIHADAHGFLWFATEEGLSRFDGETFRNYGTQNGLRNAALETLLETRDGSLWLGTQDGLCRFAPGGPPERLFVCHDLSRAPLSHHVLSLLEDRAGTIWAGTADGLFRVERLPTGIRAEKVDLHIKGPGGQLEVGAVAEGKDGCLWAGTMDGLARRCGERPFRHFPLQRRERDHNRVFSLLVDRAGRIWAGLAYDGVLVFKPGGEDWNPPQYLLEAARRAAPPADGAALRLRLPQQVGELVNITPAEGLASGLVRGGLWTSSDGAIWIGTVGGMSRVDGDRVDRFGTVELKDSISFAGAEDRAGNLWFGTAHSGALRLNVRGFVTYSEEDGLPERGLVSVFTARDGAVDALSVGNVVSRFDGHRFTPVLAGVPAGVDRGWAHNQATFQDSRGDWWVVSGGGLYRYPATAATAALGSAKPRAIYTTSNGLGNDLVYRIYEDHHGDLWVGTLGAPYLTRWERGTGTFRRFTTAEGLLADAPTAFAEDRDGGLWIGFYHGGLARYAAGRFTSYAPGQPGIPSDGVDDLYVDSSGRLWVSGSTSGLSRLDHPSASPPRWRRYSTADGLASNLVTSTVEDGYHRIYVCTGRGVDRLDLATGDLAHFTLSDGLASSEVFSSLRDRSGDLWFATPTGLSRLSPRATRLAAPPPAFLTALRVDGRAQPLSQLGATDLAGLDLQPGERQLEIGFVAIGSEPGEATRYQHRLTGIDSGWSAPRSQNSVVYAALAPGRYDFLVRALASDGRPGRPARLGFRVLPPWWRRPWFLALAAAALAAAAYSGFRVRLAHLLSLERVRTRIATDLHDDLGASLSRISLLSEVAAREIPAGGDRSSEIVREIGGLARELFDSTADIVWAIDPRRDNLESLVTRLSEYARDVLAAQGASWSLSVPHGLDAVFLAADLRRELFLLLKEAVHNAARHSGASAVSLTLTLAGRRLRAEVADDGQGFVAATNGGPPAGDGLRNMQARAAALAGTCTVVSAPGRGARVQVELPIED